MVVYDPQTLDGGLTAAEIRRANFLLWRGHCSVHQHFKPEHCDAARAQDPACKIIVHPECDWAVVQKADLAGSTERILKVLAEAPEGSHWVVGTEIHLVNRAAQMYAGKKVIRVLGGPQCLCSTMYRIDMKHLLWCLDELMAGRVVNRIRVEPIIREQAMVALQRMLDHVHARPTAAR
jgi:quinolinate synthase